MKSLTASFSYRRPWCLGRLIAHCRHRLQSYPGMYRSASRLRRSDCWSFANRSPALAVWQKLYLRIACPWSVAYCWMWVRSQSWGRTGSTATVALASLKTYLPSRAVINAHHVWTAHSEVLKPHTLPPKSKHFALKFCTSLMPLSLVPKDFLTTSGFFLVELSVTISPPGAILQQP